MNLQLLTDTWLPQYQSQLKVDVEGDFLALSQKPHTEENFKFYLASSAVHSSNIEGNTVDFDTYLKHSEFNLHLRTKEIKEIEDLIAAYRYARNAELSLDGILEAHRIFSENLLVKQERGKTRSVQVGVRSRGMLIYLAVEPEFVRQELDKLFHDIAVLLESSLSVTEVFYYAAFIHLVFVNIHPFVDGNGRATRLLEKWFLARKLGEAAWCITSEKNYWDNRPAYYRNLKLGPNYYEVDYGRSIPFLLMLPDALVNMDGIPEI